MTLTEIQKKAVQTVGKNVLVSAGAGTGKTRVLVERIFYLLRAQKAAIPELLVLTFTEKAAHEIKTRLSRGFREMSLVGPRRDLEKAAISTFHGFASRLLKEHPVEAGVDPDFRVIEAEQAELLKEEAMREMIAKVYAEKNGAFELLPVYGETIARDGILKVFTAARHEGKTLGEFFLENEEKERGVAAKREAELAREAQVLLAKLEEIDSEAWNRFLNNKKWDGATFLDFKEWSALYKGKRKAGWKEWRALLEDLAALRLGPLAAPWKEKFEALALAFEAAYSAKKKEKGFLDFDDLQMKAVGLFRGGKPVLPARSRELEVPAFAGGKPVLPARSRGLEVPAFAGGKPALRKLRERYQRQFKFILVDEFQDTNFLQMEFVELLSSGKNLFMVGDYKQSIYGFRGAEPGIFLAKEKLYENGAEGERIFLSESFRSDLPVLDFVNRFFKTLWKEDSFPFEPLVTGTPQTPGVCGKHPVFAGSSGDSAVEMLVTEMKEEEDMRCARLREARRIAARVSELHEKDKIPYGDIAVLFQAMTLSGLYEDAFKSAGVPYFIVAGRGFYEQPEIQDLMSFLSHLERPLADIPLAATLRSPLFHITDDTLFWLCRHAKEKNEDAPLYHAMKAFELIPEISPEQRTRLEAFLRLTRTLSQLKDRMPLSDLIDKMLEGTGYELSLLMDPKGVRRYANLKKLIAMVREYETYERMPLAAFLNILKRLRAQEVRESEAQIVLETSVEAVRMMSVHAAKGLEFPVVFVADMGHQGSRSDSKAVIAHAADGYAMQVPGGEDSEMQKPYFFKWVDGAIAKRGEEEWKRLFYVAVTRAKSRLFLSGVHKKKKEEKESFREMASWMDWAMAICEGMPGIGAVKVTCDTECPVRSGPVAKENFREKMKSFIINMNGKDSAQPGSAPSPLSSPPRRVRGEGEGEFSPELNERRTGVSGTLAGTGGSRLRSIDLPVSAYVLFQKSPKEFWRTYQIGWTVGENEWAGEDAIFSDDDFSAADFGTASALNFFTERVAETAPISDSLKLIGIGTAPAFDFCTKKAAETAPISDSLKLIGIGTAPAFDFCTKKAAETAPISDSLKLIGIGTAMHGFFEHLDFAKPERFLEPVALERVFGHFGKEAVDDAQKIIRDFMGQPVFQQLRKAKQVQREIDFVLNERRGLIHGKIDILFEDEKGRWHILDYKTAAGDEEAAKKSAYDLQLEIYALAAERILKIQVHSAIIYYLKNQKAVTLQFSSENSPAVFDALEKKVCGLQQQILDYSNERMAQECELKEKP